MEGITPTAPGRPILVGGAARGGDWQHETGNTTVIEIAIPGRQTLRLRHLTLDVNGTLAVDGQLIPGVAERIAALRQVLEIHLLTADTHGAQDDIDRDLNLVALRLNATRSGAEQKEDHVRVLGADSVVAIGNGVNDVLMLRTAALGIAVIGAEGLATAALREADIAVTRIEDALDLLLQPRRLAATLRA
jgi:P-type E1-E2 ATPase